MLEILILICALSAFVAVFSYLKARKIHLHIEAIHPGFNNLMRHLHRGKRP